MGIVELYIKLDKVLHVKTFRNLKSYSSIFSYLDGLWSVVTLGMGSSSTPTTTEGTIPANDPAFDLRNRHLANQSIHLILILSNHFTNDVHRNPYRLALLHFTDTQGKSKWIFKEIISV
jgi:hypothetical protein